MFTLHARLIAHSRASILAVVVTCAPVLAQCWPQWATLQQCPGVTPSVLAAAPNGDVFAGGSFTSIGGVSANRIARWDGTGWSPLGSGVDDTVNALLVLPNGDLIAGGAFRNAGGASADRIARWDGSSWSPLGLGTSGPVDALALMPNGDVIVGGFFSSAGGVADCNEIARWDGTAWWPLGTGIAGGVYALTTLPNGDLIVGGGFTFASGVTVNKVARWNGTSWLPMGSGMNSVGPVTVNALVTLHNGDVIAGGTFVTAGGLSAKRIARWNGSNWAPLSLGMDHVFPFAASVSDLAILADGDVIVGGSFLSAGGVPVKNVARWDWIGGGWASLGQEWSYVSAFTLLPNGEMLVAGTYDDPVTQTSCNLVRLVSNCPATSTVAGSGCPSSGGSNTLAVTTLPWADATFRATGTGLPTTAIVIAATSLTSIPQGMQPLASLLSLAAPGCDLLVAPDILEAIVTTTGAATSSLDLPNTPPIVGVTFYHQMVPIELDPLGNWVSITATNSLQLTAGKF